MMNNNISDHLLSLETLEPREMLSTVNIFAAGDTGSETMNLWIDDQIVETWVVGKTLEVFQFETPDTITADQVKIEFANDAVFAKIRFDRNLRVDKIQIDGRNYETESSDVFVKELGTNSGFKQTEYLFRDGFFEFNSPRNTKIEVRAKTLESGSSIGFLPPGESFAANLDLSIAGVESFPDERSTSFRLGNREFETFTYYVEGPVTPDDIRIEFTNDFYFEGRYDLNAAVDSIAINGRVYETENPSTYSTGTWLPEDGIQPGFRQSEVLHANGYFQFSEPRSSSLTVRAQSIGQLEGSPELARFQVLVQLGGAKPTTIRAGEFTTTSEARDYQVDLGGNFRIDQIRIAFVNDYFQTLPDGDPIDLNLKIDYVALGGAIYQTEAPGVRSTGTYVDGVGVELGSWESEILHTNGLFIFD